MKVAVTGASGFVGGNLCHHLIQRGYSVIPVDRTLQRAKELPAADLDVRLGDVTDRGSLEIAFDGADAVIHLAALFNNPEASKKEFHRVNVEGTGHVLEAALHCGVGRVIHCSTVGVAASGSNPPYDEKTPYAPPDDKYEQTKCAAEQLALEFHRRNGLPLIVVRPAQVYGPGDAKAKFYRMVKRGVIVNPGKTMKHLVYIDDLCRAFELCLSADQALGKVVIIGGREAISLKELINIVARELGVKPPRIRLPALPITFICGATENLSNLLRIKPPLFRRSMDFFTRSVSFDVTKAAELLGFESVIDVPTGVGLTAAWYKKSGHL